MFRNWHGWLFMITAMLMIVVMAATLRTAMVMEQSFQWVLHSEEVMSRFSQLRAAITEAESAARSYLITGDNASFQRFQEPRKRVQKQLDDLDLMTQDSQAQHDLLQEVSLLISARFEQLDKVLERKKAGARPQELVQLVRSDSAVLKELLQSMDEGIDREARLFAEREGARREQLRSMNITTVGSGVLALGTAIVGMILLHRSQKDALRAATLETQKVQAERSDHMKSRFLANMSHEIRTPMNAILGFAELLADSRLSTRDHGYVGSIQTSGKALLELINDILDLSRVEAGRMPLNPQPVDLREVVESVSVMLSQTAQAKGITLTCHIAPEVPETLVLDALRIRQVLMNLVSNAVKFTSEGGITIEALGAPAEGDAPSFNLMLRVSDTGIGISPEDHERIFSAFEQAASSEAHAAQGTGLGLSITHRLIEMMGGKIAVTSTPGEGSIFTVTLPHVPLGTALAGSEEEPQSVDLNQLKPSRILVVDDLESNSDVIAGFFHGTHHELLFASDGLEALDKARRHLPDVILMDIRMPRMDGTWARQLLKDDPQTGHIPVIAQTASSMEGESERLRNFFDGCLRKPFDRAQLFKSLSVHLPMVGGGVPQPETSTETAVPAANPEQVTEWKDLADELRTNEAATAVRLSETLPMLEMAAFGRQLRARADKHRCEPLRRYVDALMRAVESFDLEAVERQL
jgi:signal transduction histidine kinase/DNA-binding response OmpR family regulator